MARARPARLRIAGQVGRHLVELVCQAHGSQFFLGPMTDLRLRQLGVPAQRKRDVVTHGQGIEERTA